MVVFSILYYQNGNMSSREVMKMEIILGKRLKELREERNLTQKQVSALLGLNSVTYLHYEKAQREPPLAVLVQMAQFFEVSVDYLLGIAEY